MAEPPIPGRILRRLTRLVVAIALTAWLPAVAQAYQIGTIQTTYVDANRNNRPIESTLYYPSESAGEDVPVAEGVFPIVVFGHGYLIPPSDYEFLWTGLVPDGFIVVLPLTEGNLFPSHEEFGYDIAFLVTALLEEGDTPGSPFFNHVAETSAVMGHSMGGGASFLAASLSSEITALANLAAAETDPSAIDAAAGITIPALVLAGSHDCVTPPEQHQIPMYEALTSDCKTYVSIAGGSHCQFAEENLLCSLGEGGCPDPSITREEQHELTLAALSPWLRFVLAGDLAGWTEFQAFLAADDRISWDQDCDALSATEMTLPPPSLPPLLRAYPSPFRGQAVLQFELGEPATASLTIHDITGRQIRLLRMGHHERGLHAVSWDGRDAQGHVLPHGLYLGRLQSNGRNTSARLVLLP